MTDKEQIAMLRKVLQDFVDKVDRGEARSERTYSAAKEALAATAPSVQGQERVDERAALKALVEAKDYKDRYGKDQVYERMQLVAWKQARAALRSEWGELLD